MIVATNNRMNKPASPQPGFLLAHNREAISQANGNNMTVERHWLIKPTNKPKAIARFHPVDQFQSTHIKAEIRNMVRISGNMVVTI